MIAKWKTSTAGVERCQLDTRNTKKKRQSRVRIQFLAARARLFRTRLWGNIKEALKVLAKKIEPKVYLYGFLLDETMLPEDEHEEVTEIPETKPAKAAKPKTKKAPKNQMVVNNYGTVNIYEK